MKRRLAEDRALRDAARAVLDSDVGFIKADVAEHGVASRVLSTGADYARIMADGAADVAKDHRGKLSGGLAILAVGLAAWIYRNEIGDLVSGMVEGLQPDDTDSD